jgi:hypothetical protein
MKFNPAFLLSGVLLLVLLAACDPNAPTPTPIAETLITPTVQPVQPTRRSAPPTELSTASETALPDLSNGPSPTPFPRPTVPSGPPVAVEGHPRLWLTAGDLPRLRAWANDSNPIYTNGLLAVAEELKGDMDQGKVPRQDGGGTTWEDYTTEKYAALFAFMSLVSNDPAARDDYARRARSLLMYVINEAAKGPADDAPFRDSEFSTSDRSRWAGESFGLTVDWIYPTLTAEDKATIRKVFLRWSDELVRQGYHHPEPVGVTNSPELLSDRLAVRWAGNNYVTGNMRNLGLMAMALDPADDPGGELSKYLSIAIGAHLYQVDYLFRNDSRGGQAPEGFEYSPQTISYVIQFMLALHTAGQDNPAKWGKQVSMDNPFWDDFITAYFHSHSPGTITDDDSGQLYQPAWYGDGQNYRSTDFIDAMAPLGIYDYLTGNASRLAAIRWLQTNMAPGGREGLLNRVADDNDPRKAILYFMLFEPGAPEPPDPRPSLPLNFYVPGIGHIFSRTGWDPNAVWFNYSLGWQSIDHQHGDGNSFEFYRGGEWLTKERTGYGDIITSSDYHNTLALQNGTPAHLDPNDYRYPLWQRGSQWALVSAGDGQILAYSFGKGYTYALGEATRLYNSEYETVTDIVHASRSIVWLQPDHIVVYDRATSRTDGRFKRFWLQLPGQPTVSGNRSTMTTGKGQQLFVTTLLPTNAHIVSDAEAPESANYGEETANGEPMAFRLKVEAPGGPRDVRFLNVLQGADAGASADAVDLIESSQGTPFQGVAVRSTAILFPVDLGIAFGTLTYNAPPGITTHLITGLQPNGSYDADIDGSGGRVRVTVRPGSAYRADSGGVLALGGPASQP